MGIMFFCRKASNGHHCLVLEKGMDGINGFFGERHGWNSLFFGERHGSNSFLGEKKNYSAANPNENNRLSART